MYYKKNKFKNKHTICNKGHKHPSRLEARYCNELQLKQKAGEFNSYVYEQEFVLHGLKNGKVCIHKPDFLITHNDGSQEVHEVKSKATKTASWNLKRKLFIQEYPNIKYTVVGVK